MRYKFVKQNHVTENAAACIAMVCKQYKKDTSVTRLRDELGTDLRGADLIRLSKCAEKLGFMARPVRVDKESFFSDYFLPVIAQVVTKDGKLHFVVIFKISKKYVIIGDPADKVKKEKTEEFYKTFTGAMLLLKPEKNFNAGELKKDKIFKRYVKLLIFQKKLFVYALLASVIIAAVGIFAASLVGIIYDEIIPYKQKEIMQIISFVFIGLLLVSLLVNFMRRWILLHLSMKIDMPLTLGYFKQIYKMPMKFFSTRKPGDIITRFSDVFARRNIFTHIALSVIIDAVMALITGLVLYYMNPKLFAIIFFMSLICLFFVYVFLQPCRKINEEQMQISASLNSEIIEGLNTVETIKINANEEAELGCIEEEYIKSLRVKYKKEMLANVQKTISGIIFWTGNIMLIYAGISQVIDNKITLGEFITFMTLAQYYMSPFNNMLGTQMYVREAGISMERLLDIFDYEEEAGEEKDKEKNKMYREIDGIEGDICLSNVTFRYGDRNEVLKDISFTIPKGKKVAVVGAGGSGKSTIAKLLLKYFEPEKGEITIGGVNIKEIKNESLRAAISYVPQTIELFSKNIYDNIRISRPTATLDEVKKASRAAGAHEFIMELPMQYHTFLDETKDGLSGGEKQKIAFARAFLKESSFYIVDECTGCMDYETENALYEMIYEKLQNKSALIIGRRLTTIKKCDWIIVLDKGRIVEQGTHMDLLMKKGYYYKLWKIQQENYSE